MNEHKLAMTPIAIASPEGSNGIYPAGNAKET